MIASPQNPKIKWVRDLQAHSRARREANACIVEGVRLAEEALAAGWPAQLVLFTAELSLRGQAALSGFQNQGAPAEEISPQLMRQVSDTETPQGLLVALSCPAPTLPPALDFVFIPDNIRDPGNLGTMLRTAAAAGVQAVLIPPGTTDPLSPKVLRAGMGAHFHLPVASMEWEAIRSASCGLQVFVAAAGAGLPYTTADFHPPLALVVGSEAEGASPAAREMVHSLVGIPMPGGTESLNAAIAAGVLLFEVVRQRHS